MAAPAVAMSLNHGVAQPQEQTYRTSYPCRTNVGSCSMPPMV